MRKITVLALLLLLPLSMAQHQEDTPKLSLSTSKETFTPGEQVVVTATILNTQHGELPTTVRIASLLYDSARTGETEYLVEEQLELVAGDESVVLHAFTVPEDMKAGQYTVSADATFGQFELYDSLTFTITGTKEYVEMDIHICEDAACDERTKVFILGDPIYVSAETDPEDAAVEFTVNGKAYASKQTKLDQLPAGTHELTLTASREGYLPRTITDYVGILESEPEILDSSRCDGDTICDPGETPRNCPTDCAAAEEEDNTLFYIGVAAASLSFLIAFLVLRRKKPAVHRKRGSSKFHPNG